MTPRREIAAALGLVVAGALLALLAGGRHAAGTTPGVPVAPGTSTGSGAPAALALVALAGAGATLLVRNLARTALGVVLALVGVGLLAAGVTPTRWAALAGGVLVVLGGALVVVRAWRWPQPRARYEAPTRRPESTPRDTWDALDRGEDPTA